MDVYKVDFDKLYAKFETIAAANGYQRPNVALGYYYPPNGIDDLLSGWPIFAAIAILVCLLFFIRYRRFAGTIPEN